MRKKLLSATFFAAFAALNTFTLSALAGQESHGGRAWICKDARGKVSFELFDYQYARDEWGITPALPSGSTELEIIDEVLKRLDRLEPFRAEMYRKKAKAFLSQAKMSEYSEFIDVKDMELKVGLKKDCQLVQFIFQRSGDPTYPEAEKSKFRICESIWKQLDVQMRAAATLHEIIYEEAIEEGHKTADAAIYIHAKLASNELDSMRVSDWVSVLKHAHLAYFDSNGWGYDTASPLTVMEDGLVIEGSAIITKQWDPLWQAPAYVISQNSVKIRALPINTVYVIRGLNGKIRSVEISATVAELAEEDYSTFSVALADQVTIYAGAYKSMSVYFYSSGEPLSFYTDSWMRYKVPKERIGDRINYKGTITQAAEFYEYNRLRTIFGANYINVVRNNSTILVGGSIMLSENGRLIAGNGKDCVEFGCKPLFNGNKQEVRLLNDPTLFFPANGSIPAPRGLFSTYEAHRFIRAVGEGKGVRILICLIDNQYKCAPIVDSKGPFKKVDVENAILGTMFMPDGGEMKISYSTNKRDYVGETMPSSMVSSAIISALFEKDRYLAVPISMNHMIEMLHKALLTLN